MGLFNLMDYLNIKSFRDNLFFKFAMGYRHQKNREQYSWWDYDELAGGQSPNMEEWNTSVSAEPSLSGIVNEAISHREKFVSACYSTYGIPNDVAKKMVKTYIGYSPAYGGYLCQIGPYIPGKPAIPEAMNKFSFYVFRKRKSDPKSVNDSIINKINKFSKYADLAKMVQVVKFEPEDFSYNVKVKTEQEVSDEQKKRIDKDHKKRRVPPYRRINSLDPNNPQIQEFFQNPPIEGEGTGCTLNSKGKFKILQQYMGPWYQNAIAEQVAIKQMPEEEVVKELLSDEKALKIVYARAKLLWQKAKDAGDPIALSIGTPPDYMDKRLSGYSGQQRSSGPGKSIKEEILDENGNVVETRVVKQAPRTKLLIRSLNQRREVLQILSDIRSKAPPAIEGGAAIDEAQEVADRLNQNEKRVLDNKNRAKAKNRAMAKLDALSQKQAAGDITGEEAEIMLALSDEIKRNNPVIWTREDVDLLFREMKEDNLSNPAEAVAEISSKITEIDDGSGYDDLLTAFNMAKMFFSATSVDGVSGAKVGGGNSIIFNPPENFNNYTVEDVRAYSEIKEKGEAPPEFATPEELQKEIGDADAIQEDPFAEEDEEIEEEAEVEPLAPTQNIAPVPKDVTPANIEGVPDIQPAPVVQPPVDVEDKKKKKRQELEELFGSTLKNLIKIAEDLDKDGKTDAAEEVHKVIRKYEEKL